MVMKFQGTQVSLCFDTHTYTYTYTQQCKAEKSLGERWLRCIAELINCLATRRSGSIHVLQGKRANPARSDGVVLGGGGVGRLSVISQLALGRGPIKSNSDSESDPLTSRHLSVQESDAHLLFYVHLLQGLDEFAEGNAHVPVGVSLLNSPVSDAAQLII